MSLTCNRENLDKIQAIYIKIIPYSDRFFNLNACSTLEPANSWYAHKWPNCFSIQKRRFLPRNFHLFISHFACVGQVVGQMRKRRQNELAAVLPFSLFDPDPSGTYGVNSKREIWTFNAEKPPKTAVFPRNLVRVTGFEPAASCSQSRRATNCATPGYLIF